MPVHYEEVGGGGGGGGNVVWGAIAIGQNFIGHRDNATVLGPGTGISESLIKALYAVSSFTNSVGTVEIGSTVNNVTFNWAYNRNADNPVSQGIAPTIGAVAAGLRTVVGAGLGLVADTTYTLSGVGDDVTWGAAVGNPFSATTSVLFRPGIYFGVDPAIINTGAGIMAAFAGSATLSSSRAFSHNFDASAGAPPNYLYIAYPTSFGAVAASTFGGFAFSDYTTVVDALTNASGYTQNYYILRTNNTYNSAGLVWAIS